MTHAVTQSGNTITFTNTLTKEQLEKHESWLRGHGMDNAALAADKIVLTFDSSENATKVFEEIFAEGALDADEWDDDTEYNNDGVASFAGVAEELDRPKKAKKAPAKKPRARAKKAKKARR